jgi:hypothetical protein
MKGEFAGLSVHPPIVAWQRFGKHVPAATSMQGRTNLRTRFL